MHHKWVVVSASLVIPEQLFLRIKAQLTGEKVQRRVRLKDGEEKTLPKNKFFISHMIAKAPAACLYFNVQNNGSSWSVSQFYNRFVSNVAELSIARNNGERFCGWRFSNVVFDHPLCAKS